MMKRHIQRLDAEFDPCSAIVSLLLDAHGQAIVVDLSRAMILKLPGWTCNVGCGGKKSNTQDLLIILRAAPSAI